MAESNQKELTSEQQENLGGKNSFQALLFSPKHLYSHCTVDPVTFSFCSGAENEKLELTSNIHTLSEDQACGLASGLCLCGLNINKHSVIVNATYLNVQGKNIVLFS